VRQRRERNGILVARTTVLDSVVYAADSPGTMPHRERYLFVCTNRRPAGHPKGSCADKGSEELVSKLKAAIAEGGGKATVRACATGCLDLCEVGISIVQEPEHVAYGYVTAADIPELASAALQGQTLARLVVFPAAKG